MNKKNRLPLIFLLLTYLFFNLGFSLESEATGTLIVNYQTGQRGERLSRIRFWLKNENKEPKMYPKGSNYVDDEDTPSRTVVIENLKSGKYTINFLVPNKDAFFEEVPSRELTIKAGETLKINQKIKPVNKA
jgi:hypothetical protein